MIATLTRGPGSRGTAHTEWQNVEGRYLRNPRKGIKDMIGKIIECRRAPQSNPAFARCSPLARCWKKPKGARLRL